MAIFDVGVDFDQDPAGRYFSDNTPSGEKFREDFLLPRLKEALAAGEILKIVLDNGVESYGSSFLSEGFAGIVKYGYMEKEVLNDSIEFEYSDPDFAFFAKKIREYICSAKFSSASYKSTRDDSA